jgi:hypothetical protein
MYRPRAELILLARYSSSGDLTVNVEQLPGPSLPMVSYEIRAN